MSRKLLRCRHCARPVLWLRYQGRWRLFDATPVPAGDPRPTYPVENGRTAWRLPDLVEDLQARRACSRDDAETEARDMPWHTPHDCPQDSPRTHEEVQP